MPMAPQGLSKMEVLERLQAMKARDLPWRSGKVLAYIYDGGESVEHVTKDAYAMYLAENGLDFTSFPSMVKLERDVIRAVADLLRGSEGVVGSFTSGGTESILCAVKTARDWARAHRPHITTPEIVMPLTAHPAFYKAAWYFGLKVVACPFDPQSYRADVAAMREAITENTILLVGSAPGYAQGVVDPIAEIGQLALARDLLFHVDACVGGIHLSIMRRAGFNVPDFDFSIPGVTSMSTDMHKYGYAAKGASTVLYRNAELRRFQYFACVRTTTYAFINSTVMSTKSGGPVAGAWAALHFLGEDGYAEIVREVMETTHAMIDAVNAIDELHVLGKPEMCMFSFASDALNIYQVADAMKKRGWYLQPQFSTPYSPANLHVTVTRANVGKAPEFAVDLRDAVNDVLASDAPIRAEDLRAQLLNSDSPQDIRQLSSAFGIQNGTLPDDLALVNTALDILPDDVVEELLIDFMSDLFA
ncbi:MAG: aspartate aminotransferase family protein [Candidatus Hydrogenedentota bacterium]